MFEKINDYIYEACRKRKVNRIMNAIKKGEEPDIDIILTSKQFKELKPFVKNKDYLDSLSANVHWRFGR